MPTKQQVTSPVQAHAMLRNSPAYQAFIEYHGRWVSRAKVVVIVRSFQQMPLEEARQQVADWLDTEELIVRKDGMVNVASIFLAMGY